MWAQILLLFSADFIHAILWDMSPEQFIGAFDSHLRERFTVVHCVSLLVDLVFNLTLSNTEKHFGKLQYADVLGIYAISLFMNIHRIFCYDGFSDPLGWELSR